jgi:hypothetical protein
MSAGRIVLLVFGIIFLVASVFLLIGGGGLVWANAALTDSGGFFTTDSTRLQSDSYAIASEPADIDWGAGCDMGWCRDPGDFLTIKVEAETSKLGIPEAMPGIFIGIGPEVDVADYLDDVEYDEITQWSSNSWGTDVEYRRHPGDSQPADPTTQTFWEVSAYGTGTRTLEWEPRSGNWVMVIMNEDGSFDIDAIGAVGARVPWVFWLGIGLLIAGAVALPAGIVMVYFAARRPK